MLNAEPILLLFSCRFHEGAEEVFGMRPAAPHVLGMPLHAHDETLAGHLYTLDNPIIGRDRTHHEPFAKLGDALMMDRVHAQTQRVHTFGELRAFHDFDHVRGHFERTPLHVGKGIGRMVGMDVLMERAAKLLTDNSDMSIARVATLCGYDETNSFGRSFKRAYGVTPSQYRGQ